MLIEKRFEFQGADFRMTSKEVGGPLGAALAIQSGQERLKELDLTLVVERVGISDWYQIALVNPDGSIAENPDGFLLRMSAHSQPGSIHLLKDKGDNPFIVAGKEGTRITKLGPITISVTATETNEITLDGQPVLSVDDEIRYPRKKKDMFEEVPLAVAIEIKSGQERLKELNLTLIVERVGTSNWYHISLIKSDGSIAKSSDGRLMRISGHAQAGIFEFFMNDGNHQLMIAGKDDTRTIELGPIAISVTVAAAGNEVTLDGQPVPDAAEDDIRYPRKKRGEDLQSPDPTAPPTPYDIAWDSQQQETARKLDNQRREKEKNE